MWGSRGVWPDGLWKTGIAVVVVWKVGGSGITVTPPWLNGSMFDVTEHLDQLRRRETAWLVRRRSELVREQRRLHVEELAVTRILDERGVFHEGVGACDGVSERTVRETVETALRWSRCPRSQRRPTRAP